MKANVSRCNWTAGGRRAHGLSYKVKLVAAATSTRVRKHTHTQHTRIYASSAHLKNKNVDDFKLHSASDDNAFFP